MLVGLSFWILHGYRSQTHPLSSHPNGNKPVDWKQLYIYPDGGLLFLGLVSGEKDRIMFQYLLIAFRYAPC